MCQPMVLGSEPCGIQQLAPTTLSVRPFLDGEVAEGEHMRVLKLQRGCFIVKLALEQETLDRPLQRTCRRSDADGPGDESDGFCSGK